MPCATRNIAKAMIVIEAVSEMRRWGELQRRQNRRIVLVPTMGFLHDAHLSLVRDAKQRGDRVVVSIFVNPTQFVPGEDYESYPRDFARDRRLLENHAVDVLFHPSVEEIYPEGFATRVDVTDLSTRLCGAFRPGHFAGVATVVMKLFNIVGPQVAIFGRKDYQQLQIIRRLVEDLNLDIDIVGHSTVREPDGVAMSSRNAYLTPRERRAARCLFRSLRRAEKLVSRGERDAKTLVTAVEAVIAAEPLATMEYVSLCDPTSLHAVDRLDRAAVLAIAVRIGRARLIDNTMIRP